jgi:hypothetical protein
MVPVYPKSTHYLNKIFPDITDTFQKNNKGDALVPAGSCRDFFLHIREEELLTVKHLLEKQFHGIAEVYLVEDLIQKGFFGSQIPSEVFKKRVGNLVILPYRGESVWWYEKHRFEQHFYAAHGGLTKNEMESIFLFHVEG